MQASGMSIFSFLSIKLVRYLHSLYTYSVSVALQAITVISMGGIADHREFITSLEIQLGEGLK